MKHILAFNSHDILLIISLVCASCGNSPPAFHFGESDASDIGFDTAGDADSDADTDSDSDTDTDNEPDSDDDTETSTDTAQDTGSDGSCVDSTGHDEDGDGILDGCDNCPSIANEDQVNSGDEDDLGNACEATGRAGLLNRIVVFEPFTDRESDWNSDLGNWSWLSDMVRGSAPAVTGPISGFYVHKTPTGGGAYAVEATFFHDQGGNSEDWTPFVGVFFAWGKNGDARKFWTCLYEWDTRGLSVWRTQSGSIVRSVEKSGVDSSSYDRDIWRRVRATFDGVGLKCEFENEIGDYESLNVPQMQIWSDMSGKAGLRIYNETATYSSFVIYN